MDCYHKQKYDSLLSNLDTNRAKTSLHTNKYMFNRERSGRATTLTNSTAVSPNPSSRAEYSLLNSSIKKECRYHQSKEMLMSDRIT